MRLDRMLRKQLPGLSLSAVYRYIRVGKIKVNGKKVKHDHRLQEGDSMAIYFTDDDITEQKKVLEEKVVNLVHTEFYRKNFNVIYEDERLLVCNKPSGLVVHGGTGHMRNDTLIDLALSHVQHTSKNKNAVLQTMLAHRIDRDTSGVILVAKDKQFLRDIQTSIRDRSIRKNYVAFCHGQPPEKKGVIDVAISRSQDDDHTMKMIIDESTGMRSISSYEVAYTRSGISKIAIDLHTGRTHQIRVHLAYLKCPIIGDERYGDPEKDAALFVNKTVPKRLYLHAEQIGFFYSELEREVNFAAPFPAAFLDMDRYLKSKER
jgi:RluA family pseudouridine synthase